MCFSHHLLFTIIIIVIIIVVVIIIIIFFFSFFLVFRIGHLRRNEPRLPFMMEPWRALVPLRLWPEPRTSELERASPFPLDAMAAVCLRACSGK